MKLTRVVTILIAVVLCSSALAQQTYKVGDRVEVFSPMSQSWVRGRVAAIDGKRYMFQADDRTLANSYWGTTPDLMRSVNAAPAPRAAVPEGGRQVSAPPATTSARTKPAQAAAAPCASGATGSVRIAGALPAPLGKGIFPNGTRFGTPGQSNHLRNASGQNSIVAVAPPGLGSFVGHYNLMVGGTWSTISERDLGNGVTERTLNWNVPEKANVLFINADGTWYRKSGGTKLSGRWIDLGQNVVQLIGYDGDDWTGSIQRWNDGICRMEMRGPLGQNEWGRRF